MKRLFFCVGIAITLSVFSSCAQHDPQSPDTSGAAPYGASGPNKVGIDTVSTPQNKVEDFPDMEDATNNDMNKKNDGTNNNGVVNKKDTTRRNQ